MNNKEQILICLKCSSYRALLGVIIFYRLRYVGLMYMIMVQAFIGFMSACVKIVGVAQVVFHIFLDILYASSF